MLTSKTLRGYVKNGTPVVVDMTIKECIEALAYHEAQDGLLEQAQLEAKRLREELAEVKRPLEAQMQRLNARVIELTNHLQDAHAEMRKFCERTGQHNAVALAVALQKTLVI